MKSNSQNVFCARHCAEPHASCRDNEIPYLERINVFLGNTRNYELIHLLLVYILCLTFLPFKRLFKLLYCLAVELLETFSGNKIGYK